MSRSPRRARPSRATPIDFVATRLDPASARPVSRQLYDELRAAVVERRLAPGARLPSTRALARQLGLARNTVLAAFEQLASEGYLEAVVGAGTRVAATGPDLAPPVPAPARAPHAGRLSRPSRRGPGARRGGGPHARLSRRGRALARTPVAAPRPAGPPAPFRPGLPAFDAFPFALWRRIEQEVWDRPPRELLGYGDPAGYLPLRAAIAAHVRAKRAVECDPEQVLVVSGSQQALDLAARLLLDPGDAVWVENPGYPGARGALLAGGGRIVPVPVDEEGLVVAHGARRAPRARLVCVTPSHQYPTGVVMSRPRRLALLAWARRAGAFVLEDDYDGEFRYTGWPLESLQGLDGGERVIYVGTFSKALLPGLRLGYAIVPRALARPFVRARSLVDRQPPGPAQAVLGRFLEDGHFARHVRRMRVLYAARQRALLAAASRLAKWVEIAPSPAGLHLVARPREGYDERALAAAALAAGVETPPLAHYAIGRAGSRGLLVGYAAFEEPAIARGVARLAQAWSSLDTRRGL